MTCCRIPSLAITRVLLFLDNEFRLVKDTFLQWYGVPKECGGGRIACQHLGRSIICSLPFQECDRLGTRLNFSPLVYLGPGHYILVYEWMIPWMN